MNTRESNVFTIDDGPNVKAIVEGVATSPDTRFVAASSLDMGQGPWSAASEFRGHCDPVYSAAFTPDGKDLVSCSCDKTLKYWELSAASSDTHETGGQFSKRMQGFTGPRDIVVYDWDTTKELRAAIFQSR